MAIPSHNGDSLRFGPFRLLLKLRQILRDDVSVSLRPKTMEVLLLLLRRQGEAVAKDEIFATVWKDTAVSEYVLTTCISELRAALGDRPQNPRFLKTVHRYGYQLLVGVEAGEDPELPASTPVVGREEELQRLNQALRKAYAGERQIVFVTGEMGIGKTTLVEELVGDLSARLVRMPSAPRSARSSAPRWLLARGQCIEQFGAGEPYMPVLEAFGRLGREAAATAVVDVLRHHAPAWLLQIPGLLPPQARSALRQELASEAPRPLLRAIADGIEALCQDSLLVLLLEDLHLSDQATLELLSALALRRGFARLLLLGTFRSAESFPSSPPFQSLKSQLLLHRQCDEIALSAFPLATVKDYLARRFPGLRLPAGLETTIHRRTEGNPLFLARLIDQLLDDGLLKIDTQTSELRARMGEIETHVPTDLRAMVEQRTDILSAEEREVLETASVAGVRIWAASLAAALDRPREDVERLCAGLIRRHGLLVDAGADRELPDLGARYAFGHAIYQQALYERIEPTRRRRLHAAIGDALRLALGDRADEHAAELASHFERCGDVSSAIDFLAQAAVAAAKQGANREAVGYLDRALSLLERTEDNADRQRRQLDLLMKRAPSTLALRGYGALEVFENYQRALDLARRLGDPFVQVSCLIALSTCQQTRGHLAAGEELAHELIQFAELMNLPPPFVAQLHNPLSQARMYRGAVAEALTLAEEAVAAMESMPMPDTPADSRPTIWADPRVMLLTQKALALSACGRMAEARAALEPALAIAHQERHPFNLAYTNFWLALYEDSVAHWEAAIAAAQRVIDIANLYDFPFWGGLGRILRGHAIARSHDAISGLAQLREGLALWSSTGARLGRGSHLNLLADACLLAGDLAAARDALDDAMTHTADTGELLFAAETYRLQAEWQRRTGADPRLVEATLRQAIDMAQEQGNKLWELRSWLALYRLLPGPRRPGVRKSLAALQQAFAGEPLLPEVEEAGAALAR